MGRWERERVLSEATKDVMLAEKGTYANGRRPASQRNWSRAPFWTVKTYSGSVSGPTGPIQQSSRQNRFISETPVAGKKRRESSQRQRWCMGLSRVPVLVYGSVPCLRAGVRVCPVSLCHCRSIPIGTPGDSGPQLLSLLVVGTPLISSE